MSQPPVADTIIIGSHMMIEGRDGMSSGMLVYVEGDILEIRIPNSKAFNLGEPVKLVMYSPDGILTMQSSVIARDDDAVFVLTPEKIMKLYMRRRKQPRVDVREKVRILEVDGSPPRDPDAEAPSALIGNISMGGVGFSATIPLKEKQIVTFEWELEGPLICRTRIVHMRLIPSGFFYGSEFVEFPKAKLNQLRAYILRKQIENRQEQKRSPFDGEAAEQN